MNTIKGKYSKKHGLQILDTLEPTNSAFRNRQITLVKDLYEQDKISSVKNVPTGKFSKKDGLKLLNTFEPTN